MSSPKFWYAYYWFGVFLNTLFAVTNCHSYYQSKSALVLVAVVINIICVVSFIIFICKSHYNKDEA